CSKIEQVQWNTWVSFQSAQWAKLGQFSVSGNTLGPPAATAQRKTMQNSFIAEAGHRFSPTHNPTCSGMPKKSQLEVRCQLHLYDPTTLTDATVSISAPMRIWRGDVRMRDGLFTAGLWGN
ncbi:hypothetical protein, partial [Pseudomonas juntendi]|uniref:hypothetical protein n=1 Tax=Pseudomonas juntendi TaxID=2666183 RepID=UPI003B433261